MNNRELLKDKKRIVIKIGSSSLTHPETGDINYNKMEQLVRTLADIRGMGKDVVLVSSGAIAVGRKSMGIKPETLSQRQALAAIGQAQLMMTYQRLFSEYNQKTAQILMTKSTMTNDLNRKLAQNTFEELLHMGVIPVVNENDTVSTYEIQFGDNDRLSAIVAALIHADLLILLTDQDGMYTDDPRTNPEAEFIDIVPYVNEAYMKMGKSTSSSDVGTGGMKAKMVAARIATGSGADMIITNANHVEKLLNILNGDQIGTLFLSHKDPDFDIMDCLSDDHS
ncbi:MAG: glutamate 5-kinase [Lachnospiraceae bacterium]|nr:glutamate 5-kinase [Lachnospiraceae bacterium]